MKQFGDQYFGVTEFYLLSYPQERFKSTVVELCEEGGGEFML